MIKLEIRNNIIKFVIAVSFGVLAFSASGKWYFLANPFLEVSYFAESIIAIVICSLSFFVFPLVGNSLRNWLEKVVAKTISTTLRKFLHEQRIKGERVKQEKQNEKDRCERYRDALVLDTSAIIDGRILEIARCGFLRGRVLVPRFVLTEVQQVADSANDQKRQRGRRGLDMLNDLKKVLGRDFTVVEQKNGGAVDDLLIIFAKKYKALLVTVDFNLNKLAKVSGVKVLNVNDLANAIRVNILPGEILHIKLTQKGKTENQGVGYLPDGTMVVVEDGSSLVGQETEVVVNRVIQKEAGKMIFAKI